jgi:hypothetical protein
MRSPMRGGPWLDAAQEGDGCDSAGEGGGVVGSSHIEGVEYGTCFASSKKNEILRSTPRD